MVILVESKLTEKTKIRKINNFLVIFSVNVTDCLLFKNCIKIDTKTNIISKGFEVQESGLNVKKKDLIYFKTQINWSNLNEKTKEKLFEIIEEDFDLLKEKEKIRAEKPKPAPAK